MSPEHDNNLQPTLEMSAPESSPDAPQAATAQAKASQGAGAATAATRALDPAPSAPAVEESAGISVSTDGHGTTGTIPPVSGTEENSAQATEAHEALPEVSRDTHQDGAGVEISHEMTTEAEIAESSETMDQLLDQFPTPEPVVTEGEIFDGRVLAVTDAGVIVDVGGKFEGLVPAQEFAESGSAIEFGPGQTIEVERLHEHKDGYVLLSHVRAHRRRVWERIEKSYRQHSDIKGKVSERIKAEIEEPFVMDGREVVITSSIGIALSPSPEAQPEHLLHCADLAMYQAKIKGKAQYAVYDGSTNAPAMERLDLELDLRGAITRGEFILYYQPIVDLDENQIVGLEALIRWAHPTRGLLLPADFLALTEETGLIVPIGQWVLGEACRQVREWQGLAPALASLMVAVNLSAKQVRQAALLSEVMDALNASNLSPSSLTLEITESLMMDDEPTTLAKLVALRGLGVHLALDDYGTGYSALDYLRRFPADTLKIDQSFVRGLGDRSEDTAIVQAVITVARSLNLRVAAEGIESQQQAEQLHAMGCDDGQGYFFARPLAAEHVPALLSNPRWEGRASNPRRAAAHLRRV